MFDLHSINAPEVQDEKLNFEQNNFNRQVWVNSAINKHRYTGELILNS